MPKFKKNKNFFGHSPYRLIDDLEEKGKELGEKIKSSGTGGKAQSTKTTKPSKSPKPTGTKPSHANTPTKTKVIDRDSKSNDAVDKEINALQKAYSDKHGSSSGGSDVEWNKYQDELNKLRSTYKTK
jgi:hypothetical protein|tara:strand:+ start:2909 stop:3289 length:381 start_codon:yes stop_codon:yes gene_type:complete